MSLPPATIDGRPVLRPPALRPGDAIGVFTPSWPAHVRCRAKYRHGLAVLRGLGFEVIEGDLTAREAIEGHRAGDPRARAEELQGLLADERVRAVVATIGGSNSSSLVPFLDSEAIRRRPTIVCGYSDVTSLHLAILRRAGVSTFYGPAVMPSFGEWPDVVEETRASFLAATGDASLGPRALVPPSRWSRHFRDAATDAWRTEPRRWEPPAPWRTIRPGVAEGPALALNLNTLLANAGTPEFPVLDGRILFVEDMATSPADAERRFRHLAALGAFERIAGLVWGRIEQPSGTGAGSPAIEALLLEAIEARAVERGGAAADFPIVTDFDLAHTVPMLTLAQETPVRVEAGPDDPAVTVLEPMVLERGD